MDSPEHGPLESPAPHPNQNCRGLCQAMTAPPSDGPGVPPGDMVFAVMVRIMTPSWLAHGTRPIARHEGRHGIVVDGASGRTPGFASCTPRSPARPNSHPRSCASAADRPSAAAGFVPPGFPPGAPQRVARTDPAAIDESGQRSGVYPPARVIRWLNFRPQGLAHPGTKNEDQRHSQPVPRYDISQVVVGRLR